MDKIKGIIVSGYFNPLHKGHLELFQKAKEFGDQLFVIVNNDKMHSWMNDSKIKALLENLREDGNKKGNI